MSFKAILFDLDGTLLPHDFNTFAVRYFGALQKRFIDRFPDNDLAEMILYATQKMMTNGGEATNQEVFWHHFSALSGCSREDVEPMFERFYREEFPLLGRGLEKDAEAAFLIDKINKGKTKTVLATNPVFPLMAIEERVRWAGLEPDMFDYIACFEELHYCKPDHRLFLELAAKIEERPADCLMVGNDIGLDLRPAASVGMRTYLVENEFQVTDSSTFQPDHVGDLAGVIKEV